MPDDFGGGGGSETSTTGVAGTSGGSGGGALGVSSMSGFFGQIMGMFGGGGGSSGASSAAVGTGGTPPTDPVSVIAMAVGEIAKTVGIFAQKGAAKAQAIANSQANWKDFNSKIDFNAFNLGGRGQYNTVIMLGLLVVLIIAIAFLKKQGKI
jgi:hypothetical protein